MRFDGSLVAREKERAFPRYGTWRLEADEANEKKNLCRKHRRVLPDRTVAIFSDHATMSPAILRDEEALVERTKRGSSFKFTWRIKRRFDAMRELEIFRGRSFS